ncbi:MAG: hypothetical protein AAGD18_05665 [Actinomycetota bacterium]
MRSLLALLLAAAIVFAACGDDDTEPAATTAAAAATTAATTTVAPTTIAPTTTAPPETTAAPTTVTTTPSTTTTTEAPPPADLPPMLLADGATVSLVEPDGTVSPLLLLDESSRLAVGLDETLIVVEQVDEAFDRSIVLYGADATVEYELGSNARLHDVVSIDGLTQVLATRDDGEGLADEGDIVLAGPTGSEEFFAVGFAPEYYVVQASIAPAAGLGATAAFADLTELVQVFSLDSPDEALPISPTDGLEYNAPPLIIHAELADDGSSLAYVEGPDSGGPDGAFVPGPWEVVVVDLSDGTERFRSTAIPADSDRQVVWLDFDGRWLVASVSGVGDDVELASGTAVLFDITTGTVRELPAVGTATLLPTG